eukprot:6481050-Amphidinium_carterae.1
MTYSRLSTRLRDSLSHTYVTLLKKTVMLKAADQILPIRDEDFLEYLAEPSWDRLVQYRIATFLPKVCASENSQVRAALAATGPSSLWTEWLPVLRELHEWSKTARSVLLGRRKPKTNLSRIVTVHAANIAQPDALLPPPQPAEDDEGAPALEVDDPEEEPGTIQCPLFLPTSL